MVKGTFKTHVVVVDIDGLSGYRLSAVGYISHMLTRITKTTSTTTRWGVGGGDKTVASVLSFRLLQLHVFSLFCYRRGL